LDYLENNGDVYFEKDNDGEEISKYKLYFDYDFDNMAEYFKDSDDVHLRVNVPSVEILEEGVFSDDKSQYGVKYFENMDEGNNSISTVDKRVINELENSTFSDNYEYEEEDYIEGGDIDWFDLIFNFSDIFGNTANFAPKFKEI
jgi:hypothetical protein